MSVPGFVTLARAPSPPPSSGWLLCQMGTDNSAFPTGRHRARHVVSAGGCMAFGVRRQWSVAPGGPRMSCHRPPPALAVSGSRGQPLCLAWPHCSRGWEGEPALECWVLGSRVPVDSEGWRHTCLGFTPRTTCGPDSDFRVTGAPGAQFPFFCSARVARR